MAIICRDLGLLFVLTPHTGSSAVGKVLREQLGGRWIPAERVVGRKGNTLVRTKHSTVADLVSNGVLRRSEVDRLHVFTTVRNPFDRLVTAYHKRRDHWGELAADPDSWANDEERTAAGIRSAADHDFPAWLALHYGGGPVRRMVVRSGFAPMYRRFTADADTVMRFEVLQTDFDAVLADVGHDPVVIPSFNTTGTRRGDYREYYDGTSRRLVERAARWDLRTFDYAF